jgi:Tfp pilus assembly protein PilN
MYASRLERRIVEAENTLRQYQAIVDQIRDIEGKKQKLIAKRDVIINLNRARLTYPVFFEDLLPLVPSDVWVSDIRFESANNIRLSSRASSNYALATWLSNLQNSTNFSNVKLDRISYEYAGDKETTQPMLSFQLTFTYNHQGPMPLTENN